MTQRSLRGWIWIHTWTSLVCTLFLLLICITGLPLVLSDEIENLLDDGLPYANVANGTAHLKLDEFVAKGRAMFPGETVLSVSSSADEPKIVVLMASSWEAFKANRKSMHWIRFDAHTGQVLKQSKPFDGDGPTFLGTMLSLHRDLYAGLPGELFMGFMAVLFVLAIVSGVVIYGPFMRRLEFGTVRANRSTRLRWLDLHNLIGVTTLAWALVVGATGILNEVSRPLFTLWQQTDVKAMLAPLRGKPVPETSELSSPQAAFDTVKAAYPDMVATSVVYPGSPFGTPYHYLIWTKGQTPLTSRLFQPVLVDARNGALGSAVSMPWYLRAVEVSRPLHFGDYGGMPLKIIWIALDLATIVVLGGGLYLWLLRRSWVGAKDARTASYGAAAASLSHGSAK